MPTSKNWGEIHISKWAARCLLVHSPCCAPTAFTSSKTFSSPQKETSCLLSSCSPLSLPQGNLYDLPILNMSQKWKHTICDLLSGFFHLAYFRGSPMLEYVLVLSSFLWIFANCLSINPLKDTEAIVLYGNSMFNFLKNCQTVSHCCWTILYSHQQCIKVPSPFIIKQVIVTRC